MTNPNTPKNEVEANEKWDEILNSPEGLDLLDSLANDALMDFENGKFSPMTPENKDE